MDPHTRPLTVSALAWTGGGNFEARSIEAPVLGAGEALAAVDLATICGSDIHTVSGRRAGAFPSILGHEAVGTIVAADTSARDFRGRPLMPGDRVIWSVTVACGDCTRCFQGVSAKCLNLLKTGHEPFDGPWSLSGGYSTHLHLRRGITVVSVPDTVSDAAAAPVACATATVMAVMQAAGPLEGKRVLVSGAGMLGMVACAVARQRGAASVHVRDINPERLALAHGFGATEASSASDGGAAVSADVAVELSGAAPAVQAALDSLDVAGRLVLAGSVSPGPLVSVDPERMVRSLLSVTGVHNYEPVHLQQAMDFVEETSDVYHWASLVEAPRALRDLPSMMTQPTGRRLRKSVAPA